MFNFYPTISRYEESIIFLYSSGKFLIFLLLGGLRFANGGFVNKKGNMPKIF
jgi:hypothetical protein